MKLVYGYHIPETDTHFYRLITKRIKAGGPAEYQDEVRNMSYQYVTDFSLCVDIGANVGMWSVPLSKKFKKVISFEPLNSVFECLKVNTNGLNVELHNIALGNVNSTVNIVPGVENIGMNTVDETTIGTGTTPIKTLDSLDLPKFGLMKVDCEGYELEILKGAINTILKYKPIIIIEQHPIVELCAANFLISLGAKKLGSVRKDYIIGW